jgi:DNA-binding LytR/AlgR family response regulator
VIKVIVLDDEEKYCKAVKEVVNKVSIQFNRDINYMEFKKYNKALQKQIEDDSIPKIYIVDIDLNDEISGINIAEKIRERERFSEIIFITNHDKMYETVYDSVYDVFGFIRKFHNFETDLYKKLVDIFKRDFDNASFIYEGKYTDLNLYYRNIMYIYCVPDERKIAIVTSGGVENRISMSIQEIMEKLDGRFKMVHRSCIVNTEKVQEYCWSKNYFVLDNGAKVDLLSKKYRNEVLIK